MARTKIDDTLESAVLDNPLSSSVKKATKSKTAKTLGGILFIVGFLIAVVAGLVNGLSAAGVLDISLTASGAMLGLMALIGLVVGLVNITDKEAMTFLIGAIAVTVAANAMTSLGQFGAGVAVVGTVTNFVAVFISSLASMISAFVGPAALVVGLKVVYTLARKA